MSHTIETSHAIYNGPYHNAPPHACYRDRVSMHMMVVSIWRTFVIGCITTAKYGYSLQCTLYTGMVSVCLYRHGQRDHGLHSMVFRFIHTLMFVAWHFETASILRKRERNILVLFLSMSTAISDKNKIIHKDRRE